MGKRFWLGVAIAGLVAAALIGALSEASAAPQAKTVAFRGSYSGRLDILLRPTGFQIVAYGRGRANVLGDSYLLGTGPTSQPRPGCWALQGLASLIGSSGDRLYIQLGQDTGCAATPGGTTFRNSLTATLLGGTGKFARAKGRLQIRSTGNSVTGAITFAFSGTLSY